MLLHITNIILIVLLAFFFSRPVATYEYYRYIHHWKVISSNITLSLFVIITMLAMSVGISEMIILEKP